MDGIVTTLNLAAALTEHIYLHLGRQGLSPALNEKKGLRQCLRPFLVRIPAYVHATMRQRQSTLKGAA